MIDITRKKVIEDRYNSTKDIFALNDNEAIFIRVSNSEIVDTYVGILPDGERLGGIPIGMTDLDWTDGIVIGPYSSFDDGLLVGLVKL